MNQTTAKYKTSPPSLGDSLETLPEIQRRFGDLFAARVQQLIEERGDKSDRHALGKLKQTPEGQIGIVVAARYAWVTIDFGDREVSTWEFKFADVLSMPEFRKLPDGISDRELEAMRWLCFGAAHKQVADRMGISQKTVEKHIQSAYAKSGCKCAIHVLRWALQHRVIEVADWLDKEWPKLN